MTQDRPATDMKYCYYCKHASWVAAVPRRDPHEVHIAMINCLQASLSCVYMREELASACSVHEKTSSNRTKLKPQKVATNVHSKQMFHLFHSRPKIDYHSKLSAPATAPLRIHEQSCC